MASRDFEALSARRTARARFLAERHPASREVLTLYGAIASFQLEITPQLSSLDSLLDFRAPLQELVGEHGSAALCQVALELDDTALRAALDDYWEQRDTTSKKSFFARVLLQPYAASSRSQPASRSERQFVLAALVRAGGRPGLAARELGMSRQGLAKLMKRLDLSRPA